MNQKQPTLVIMAAGMGSRFGGLKQMTPVDAEGDFILDFSLFDAYRAGFRRVAFIIKPEMEDTFRERVGGRVAQYFHIDYIHQTSDILPEGYAVPEGREKPWGTGHAVACCRGIIEGPFAVINADDFYGETAFSTVYRFLTENEDENCYAMIGYRLRNTVTENGSVARGVCEAQDGLLTGITERTKIYKRGDDAAYTEDGQTFVPLSGDSVVSMNFWGFTNSFLDELWARFPAFLDKALTENPLKGEYFLPSVVNDRLAAGEVRVRLLPCEENWYGVTYKEDLAGVQNAVAAMKEKGRYPKELWAK